MNTNNSFVISIYKSRNNILEILEERGFNVENYSNLSIGEVGILAESEQLDMLLTNEKTNKKIYVKYYINKVLKPQNIFEITTDFERLFFFK